MRRVVIASLIAFASFAGAASAQQASSPQYATTAATTKTSRVALTGNNSTELMFAGVVALFAGSGVLLLTPGSRSRRRTARAD